MLLLANFLLIVGVMTALAAYAFWVAYLSVWAGDEWGAKGPISVVGFCIVLPMAILCALVMTYGA